MKHRIAASSDFVDPGCQRLSRRPGQARSNHACHDQGTRCRPNHCSARNLRADRTNAHQPAAGIGTVVTNRGTNRRVFRLSGFFGHGSIFRVKKIASTTESANAEGAKALQVIEGALVRHQRYIALHQNQPFTLTDADEVEADEPSAQKARSLSGSPSRRVARAEQELIAVISDGPSEKYLGYPAGQPMMEARRIVFASDGLPIHYFIPRYHPERYKFLVDMLPTKGVAIFEGRQD